MATTKVQSELIVDDVALAGNPTTTTQGAGNNTTRIATTAFVTTAVDNLIASAPGTMDTLNEIAAALNDDPSFTTTVNNAIATKLNLSGGTLTGNLTVPYLATTSYIDLNNSGNRGKIGWSGNHTYIATTSSVGSIIFKNNVSSTAAPQTGGDTLLTLADNGNATFAGTVDIDGASLTVGASQEVNIVSSGSSLFPSLKVNNNGYIGSASVTDALQFQTSGDLKAKTKLGIGIDPAEMLDIQSASGDARIRLDAPSGSDTEIKFFNAGVAQYTVGHDDATDNFVIGGANVDAPLVSLTKQGTLGIGVPDPDGELHVESAGNADVYVERTSGAKIHLQAQSAFTAIGAASNHDLGLTTNASVRMRIDNTGRVGINRIPAISNSKLEVGGADNVPLINVEASGATAGVGIGSSRMKFYYGTSEKMSLDSSGNLRTNRQVIQENSDGTPRFINIPYSSAGSGFTFNWDDLANHSAVGDQSSETNAFMFEVNVTSYLFRRIKALIIVDTNANNSISVQTLHSSTLTCTATIPTNSEQITITIGGLWSNAVNYMGRITTF